MKKSIILCAMLIMAFGVRAQSPQWIIGKSLVPFSSSGPGTPVTLTGAAGYNHADNTAFDASGNLLFYVWGEKVYNSSSSYAGRLGDAGISTPESEIALVQVPGFCNEFYVITTSPFNSCITCPPNHIQYNKVTVNGSSVTVGSTQNLGYTGIGGFAISKLRTDKTRFLFYAGETVERFVISATGISHAQTIMNSAGHIISDMEVYEDNVTGNMRLAWGDNYAGLQIVTLNSSGNYVSNYVPTIMGLNDISGVEFINYNEILIANDNANASNTGIAKVSFGGSLSVTFFPNTSAYYNGHIEKAIDGQFYTTKGFGQYLNTQSYKLASIDYTNATVTEVPGITLPDMGINQRLLPDQVDNENYASTNYWADLMSRDAVNDLGIEPNPSDDVWSSPDIWNRRNSAGSPTDNQDPGYGGGGNLMKVRIRNRGCVTSQPSYVKLYWTLGATMERWPASWNGSTLINGVAAGNEIKNYDNTYDTYVVLGGVDKGYVIPALLPGQETVITAKWYPPDPATYNDPRVSPTAMICFLARIDDPLLDPMYSEQSSTTSSVGRNVKYNNNIVTRNSFLINLGGSYMVVPSGGTILLGNYFEEATFFDIRFHGLTSQDANFAGLGNVTLRMDERLWDAWIGSGAIAEGVSISNYENREVLVNDLNNVVLRNVRMQPGEVMGIGSFFQLSAPTDVVRTYQFAFSQMKSEATVDEEEYGSQCVFSVSVNGQDGMDDDGTGAVPGTPLGKPGQVNEQHAAGSELAIYPNPANDKVTIRFAGMKQDHPVQVDVADMSGRIVQQSVEKVNCNGSTCAVIVNTKALKGGMYIISLNVNGVNKSVKVEVTH